VTASTYIAGVALLISSIVAVSGWLYRRGGSDFKAIRMHEELERSTDERFERLESKMKYDLDGLGKMMREIRSKEERRFKQQIVASVNAAETLKQAKEFVDQLKNDAWTDEWRNGG
jgi:lipopolysaccharide biosynthesis regulator YciM